VIREELPAALGGERLDRLVALIADISRSAALKVIDAGGVRVDGQPASSGKARLEAGQVVEVDPDTIPRSGPPEAQADVEFAVVDEDPAFVVVDKPPGLVVHPGAGHPDGTLVNGLLARYPELAGVGDPARPGLVHRLDAGSSGLLVVARRPDAADALIGQFAARTAGRRYDAVVWGHPEAPHGIVDAPIGRDPSDPLKMAVVVAGRPARTEYRVVTRFDAPAELARLSCRLQTGRTHQIRVHLAAVGHPLVGDSVYGDRRTTFGLRRPFLHAAELSFDHPVTGARLSFTSPLPADLLAFLRTTTTAAAPSPPSGSDDPS
jgi:23S rRNA pseudouridine1911/1915/1917 synthase